MLKYIFIFLIMTGCMSNINSRKKFNLFTPISLSADTTKLFIKDFLIDEYLDSVSCQIPHFLNENKSELFLLSNQNISNLSILKLWSKGNSYDILLRKNKMKDVTISYNPQGVKYSKVSIAGQFNDWNPSNDFMISQDSIWILNKKMNPGKYQYQIVVDGIWNLDKSNPKKVSNGSGGY